MPDDNRKSERPKTDPADIEKLIELELMQKRLGWQRAKARRNNARIFSLLFLFAVIFAALVAYFIFFSPDRINELRTTNPHRNEKTPSPTASPANVERR